MRLSGGINPKTIVAGRIADEFAPPDLQVPRAADVMRAFVVKIPVDRGQRLAQFRWEGLHLFRHDPQPDGVAFSRSGAKLQVSARAFLLENVDGPWNVSHHVVEIGITQVMPGQ